VGLGMGAGLSRNSLERKEEVDLSTSPTPMAAATAATMIASLTNFIVRMGIRIGDFHARKPRSAELDRSRQSA
jgi:hypothetical protein